jgi:hypothetical protein
MHVLREPGIKVLSPGKGHGSNHSHLGESEPLCFSPNAHCERRISDQGVPGKLYRWRLEAVFGGVPADREGIIGVFAAIKQLQPPWHQNRIGQNLKRANLDRDDLSLAMAVSMAIAPSDDTDVDQILEKLDYELSH